MKNCIINGDCIEILKTIADESVDFVLTDPPYFVRGVLPNFPPIISRVRRLSRPLLGALRLWFWFHVRPSFSGRPSLFEGG